MGWIRCARCVKLQCDFVAQTFVLIAPVHYVLQQVSCSDETIPNAPKYYETHRNISLVSSGVDQVRSLRKITTWLRGTNFVLIAPIQYVLHQLSSTYEVIRTAPKYYETHQNISLGSNGVDQVHSLQKITTWLCGTNFCINCTRSVCFTPTFMHLRNDPKCTEILRNTPKQ